jgi:hypothetical protein
MDHPNTVVFARPTRIGDRLAFGLLGGLGVVAVPAYVGLMLHDSDFSFANINYWIASSFLTAWLTAIAMLAVAYFGGTTTVTLDRRARRLSEVTARGPLTACDRVHRFKDLGEPSIHEDAANKPLIFRLEIPAKDAADICVSAFATRAEAEVALRTVRAALDPTDLPRFALPIGNELEAKTRSILAQGPFGPGM